MKKNKYNKVKKKAIKEIYAIDDVNNTSDDISNNIKKLYQITYNDHSYVITRMIYSSLNKIHNTYKNISKIKEVEEYNLVVQFTPIEGKLRDDRKN